MLDGMQKNRQVLVAEEAVPGQRCTLGRFSVSPFVALYPRVFVFPTVAFSVPSIFSFSQQYLSDDITSEAEQSFLSVRDKPHERFFNFAVKGKTLVKNSLLSLQCYQLQRLYPCFTKFPIPKASITWVHFSQMLI